MFLDPTEFLDKGQKHNALIIGILSTFFHTSRKCACGVQEERVVQVHKLSTCQSPEQIQCIFSVL